MKVTVLMPVYNSGKYIKDAIDSLLNQTDDNWKLICIDDGSTDNSIEIINSYIRKDSRISLLCQENSGPAVARAKAIKITDTEYVSILDSDDAYCHNYIELMLKRAEETDADSIVPDVEFGYGNTKKLPNIFIQHNLSPDMIINNGVEAFAMTIPWQLHGWQMIKTDLAKKYYTIENASYSKFNSDEYITRLLYLKSKKIALCNARYFYRISPDSLTRAVSLKKLDYLITIDKLLSLCYKENVPVNIIINVLNNFYCTLKSMIKLSYNLDNQEKNIAIERIKNAYYKSYRPNIRYSIIKCASKRTQVKFLLSYLGLFMFKII